MKTIAIIGASVNREKYGNKAVRAYVKKGWTVFPVNPKESEIEGLPCYPSIHDIPEEIDAVSLYVPPTIGLTLVDQIAHRHIVDVYLNPGAESDDLIEKFKKKGIIPHLLCSIVAIGERPE